MKKLACIIAAGEWGGHRTLFKVRDRNYTPKITLVHELRGDVEVAYIRDEVTGWCEGLNDRGLGVVNAALAVGADEAEKKLVKTIGKKSKDGERILKVLEQTSLDEAEALAKTFKGGIKGHTFISTPRKTITLEQTSRHEVRTKPLDAAEDHSVRTNHGVSYADAGYTEGPNYISSVVRRERATSVLAPVKRPEDLAPALMAARSEDRHDPNNMVRDTDNMSTTSQMVLDLTARELHLFLIPGKSEYEGLERDLPDGYEPKVKVRLYRYSKDGSEVTELDPETGKEKGKPRAVKASAARVAARALGLRP